MPHDMAPPASPGLMYAVCVHLPVHVPAMRSAGRAGWGGAACMRLGVGSQKMGLKGAPSLAHGLTHA
eukprot:355370-Chlamydomonas_euryale.AAC.3